VREITDRETVGGEPGGIVAFVASTAWMCDCGRRVPPFIFTCRCGAKRPADAGGVARPAASARPDRPPAPPRPAAAPRPPAPPVPPAATRPPATPPPVRPAAARAPAATPPNPPSAPAPAPSTVLRKPTTLRPPSNRAIPTVPTLAPTPLPVRVPAPLPPLREETGAARELGFRIKPKARPVRRFRDLPRWAQKAAIGLGVVALYFAARELNRFRVSFAARDAAIEALIPLMGLDAARTEAGRQQSGCFAKGYQTGWVKWQDYSFDQAKHADCVVRAAMADVARRNLVASRAARAAEEAKRPKVVAAVATPRPPPPPPRTPPPVLGRVAVGNVQVLQLTRSPNISGRLSFVAIGSADALASVSTCSYTVTCDGNAVGLPAGQRAIAPCPLKVKGSAAPGELSFLVLAPAQGACSLDLTLTDGARSRSATVAIPLS